MNITDRRFAFTASIRKDLRLSRPSETLSCRRTESAPAALPQTKATIDEAHTPALRLMMCSFRTTQRVTGL